MDLKEFFKPQISKIIIFIILLLLFGVPAFYKNCATYDFGTGEFPCGPPRFTLHNPLIKSQMLDAVNIYSYNPLVIASYLVVLYSILSLIYFYTKENKAQRIVFLISFIVLFVVLRIWISIL